MLQMDDSLSKEQNWYLFGKACIEDQCAGAQWKSLLEQRAKECGYSAYSMQRFVDYARALEHLDEQIPGLKAEILEKKHRLSLNSTLSLARRDKETIIATLKRLADENVKICEIFPEEKDRRTNSGKKSSKTVKDTPAYDPDAQAMGLVYTIPSWMIVMDRVNITADFNAITVNAHRRLKKALEDLRNFADTMLTNIMEGDSHGSI